MSEREDSDSQVSEVLDSSDTESEQSEHSSDGDMEEVKKPPSS